MYDLLLKGGTAVDPSTGLHGVHDIAIEQGNIARIETQIAELTQQEVPVPPEELPPQLVGQKFPPLFVVETEYALTLIKAELAFVNELVRRIVEEGWGPVDLWRNLQAVCAHQHEINGVAREGAM